MSELLVIAQKLTLAKLIYKKVVSEDYRSLLRVIGNLRAGLRRQAGTKEARLQRTQQGPAQGQSAG